MSMPVGQTATHSPQSTQSPCRLAELSARLAAPRVVADHERVGIEQHALEARVGAQVLAEGLAHEREVEIGERGRDHEEARHGRRERSRGRALRAAARARRSRRRDGSRARRRSSSHTSVRGELAPGGDLLRRRPARPALDEARDRVVHIGDDRLRAGPAAPEPPRQRREEEQREREADHDQPQEVELLRKDHEPEHVELARRHVEAHQRLAGDLDPRDHQQDRDQRRRPPPSADAGRSPRRGARSTCWGLSRRAAARAAACSRETPTPGTFDFGSVSR